MDKEKDFDAQVDEFLNNSNWIEEEYSSLALEDAKHAWDWAYSNRNERIDVQYILKIHSLLMKNINPEIAGVIRNCDVYIGGNKKIFVSESLIKTDLFQLVCKKMDKKERSKKEEFAQKTHVAFENCHPFVDGNGRSGRILYNIHRIKLGLPLHIIHQGDEQKAYYGWFK